METNCVNSVIRTTEKVKLVNECQNNPADDGYEVVEKFLESHLKIKDELSKVNRNISYGERSFERYVAAPAV